MFDRLPEYPWEQLKPYSAKAALHERGAVDLSVGSPVDPTPAIIQEALNASSNAPGYPSTGGSPEFKAAVVEWFARRRGVEGLTPAQVMPTIGSKELISWLPLMMGLGPGDVVVQPKVAEQVHRSRILAKERIKGGSWLSRAVDNRCGKAAADDLDLLITHISVSGGLDGHLMWTLDEQL